MTVSLDGLHPTLMRPRVEALLADPEAVALGISVVSAFRSVERQRVLFDEAVKKYGGVAAARKWVAPPGSSNHGPRVDGYGTAVDLAVAGVHTISGQWPNDVEHAVNVIAARHGLRSPMDWEDWHFEPIPNWTAPAVPSPSPHYALLKESFMAVFKDDGDREVWFVRHAYLTLLHREPEDAPAVMRWVLELRDKGGDYVWSQIADSDEGQFVRAQERKHLVLD